MFFVNQVPVFIGLDLSAEEIGDGRVTDGNEGARCFNRLCGAVLGIFQARRRRGPFRRKATL